MRSGYIIFLLFILVACNSSDKDNFIENTSVEIVRDQWGVPHIKGKTDADAVYGLAWAQCEDDFVTLQEQMLAAKGMLGEVKGKDGIVADFGIKFMGLREVVEEKYDTDISSSFKIILQSFIDGVNAFAANNPKEVLLDDLFPLHPHDIVVGYMLGMVEMSGAGSDLQSIMNGTIIKEANSDLPKGSNAFAISKKKTADQKTYIAINSHQPLEGWYSWYEAHLISDEGLNILGGTFPMGVSIFHGTNENLAWAHTVNHADFSDVYELTIHPDDPLLYKYDGEWLKLEKRDYRSWLNLWAGIKIPVNKSAYQSVYGPTFITDTGTYAWRYVANQDIRAVEQWFLMNKAKDFESFKSILKMQGIACTNIVYADKEDNIYYISNGRIPERNPNYDWSGVLPGDTSATMWNGDNIDFQLLPQVENPPSGYVFNTNNSPYNSSNPDDDPVESELNKTMGYQGEHISNNRANQFLNLISQYDTVDYEDFKEIKYSHTYPEKLETPYVKNMDLITSLDPENYNDISEEINLINSWDKKASLDSEAALLFITAIKKIDALRPVDRIVTEEQVYQAIKEAGQKLRKRQGKISVPLGEVQRHIRGEVNLPIGGGPDVLAATHTKDLEGNQNKIVAGESYIELVRFSASGVEIETVNAYGSSAEPDSPHYTDQMEMFVSQKLKKMSLKWEDLEGNEKRRYHPLKIVSNK